METTYLEQEVYGSKLAATLRHLDSGAKYSDMQYSWQVAMKTLSILDREVCNT